MDTEDGLNAKRGSAVDGLPDDALVEILSRVPARSIHRFKCVSKPWRDLIADPLNRKRLPQTLEGFFFSDGAAAAAAGFRGRFIGLPGRSAPPVDPSFSFLTKLPGIQNIKLLGSCNGLLLFEHGGNPATAPAYAVCNPATEEWVAVPSAGRPSPGPLLEARTDLIFDPAVSPHFHLVHICQKDFLGEIEVRAYSSEAKVWSDRASQQSRWQDEDQRICLPFVGQSQGRLHCVGGLVEREGDRVKWSGLSIWVLEDYDIEEWVLKHRVSFLELFGQMNCLDGYSSIVLAIHPDRNLVFILQNSNQKLISYDMDSKELQVFHTLAHNFESFTPYVPNFSESLVLTNDH
ncbi:hypothetical protein BAE44_0010787 [Dichanthelium oligosanthes]|uniref:F-box domain-containing protein n=1 Tax=Dichanthelium oligosanthes TaxID=888268 RepID=A0A1E5VSX6_9POAL|nr:hypothetical protein BAE44_0010787 [Dichanthelium oligosanthes]